MSKDFRQTFPGAMGIAFALAVCAGAGRAVAQEPPSAPAPRPTEAELRADALFQEGMTLMGQNRHEEACAKLEQSLELDPRAMAARFRLGECHERIGTALAEPASMAPRVTAASTARGPLYFFAIFVMMATLSGASASPLSTRHCPLTFTEASQMSGLPALSTA